MSVLGYKARNTQQAAKYGSRADVDDRATAWEDFSPLHERFRFTVDVAALPHNAKLERYWTPAENGLMQSWAGERVWCNPPYSHPNLSRWTDKAWKETDAELIVMLVPANRTEQAWWQQRVEPFRDRPGSALRTEFLPGRMQFIAGNANRVGPNERPPFGCCLLIWDRSAGARPLPDHGRRREAVPRQPPHRPQVGAARPVAAHQRQAEAVQRPRR